MRCTSVPLNCLSFYTQKRLDGLRRFCVLWGIMKAMHLQATDITLNPDNPRTIKDDKFKKLVQSLTDFPEMAEVREVIVNKDHVILGGNMRYKAMVEAGWTQIPVKIVDWPADKQREFIIKDNVAGGEWDWDVLANEWDSGLLDEWGLDLPGDFGVDDIEEDEAPALSSEPAVSELGEIYQLGRHRLMCGDATLPDNIASLVGNHTLKGTIDLVFTDAPYGINIITDEHMVGADFGVAAKGKYNKVTNDHNTEAAELAFANLAFKGKQIWWGGNYFDFLPHSDSWLIWDKRDDSGIRNSFADAEMAWCNFHTPVRVYHHLRNGMIRADRDDRLHPTQKPIKVLAAILDDFSNEGDGVIDVFGGSGSTLIACEQTERTCYMMEIDPKYCDVIRKRYAKFINEEDWEAVTPVIRS